MKPTRNCTNHKCGAKYGGILSSVGNNCILCGSPLRLMIFKFKPKPIKVGQPSPELMAMLA